MDSKNLLFNANQSRSCAHIMLNNDTILEQMEEFYVLLTFTENQPVVLETDRAIVAIMDTNSKQLFMSNLSLA